MADEFQDIADQILDPEGLKKAEEERAKLRSNVKEKHTLTSPYNFNKKDKIDANILNQEQLDQILEASENGHEIPEFKPTGILPPLEEPEPIK